jgi:hypothetical protein
VYAADVEDTTTFPPQQVPYTKLWSELLNRLPLSREQRLRQLFTIEAMGDRKSSQFLRHLRSLAPDYLLRTIWTSRLHTNVQATLTGQPVDELDAATHCVDRIIEAVSSPVLASTGELTGNIELLYCIEKLSSGGGSQQ